MNKRNFGIETISGLIGEGKIKSLEELYQVFPKRQMASVLGKEPINFTNKISNIPDKFTLLDIKKIASFFNVDSGKIFDILIYTEKPSSKL